MNDNHGLASTSPHAARDDTGDDNSLMLSTASTSLTPTAHRADSVRGAGSLFRLSRFWRAVRAGPGVARRASPGQSLLSAGLLVRHCVEYDAKGRAVLVTHAVPASERNRLRSEATKSDTTSMTPNTPALTTPTQGEVGAREFVIPPAPWSPPSYSQLSVRATGATLAAAATATPPPLPAARGREASTGDRATPTASIPAASAVPVALSQRERQHEAEAQQHFMSWLATYPLLSVLPPQIVWEQRYTAPGDASVSASRTTFSALTTATSSRAQGELTITVGQHCDEASSLREVTWGGCRPAVMRAFVWRLLCAGYAPSHLSRQARELERKRNLYVESVQQYWPQHVDSGALCASSPSSPMAAHAASSSGSRGAARHLSLSLRDGDQPLMPTPTGSSTHRLLYYQRRSEEQRRQKHILDSLGGAQPSVHTSSPCGAVDDASGNRQQLHRHDGDTRTSSKLSLPLLQETLTRSLPAHERAILQQLALDLPRHRAAMYHCPRLIASMARCLFLWSQRHPAVGYVQGMDEVVGVFYTVFLTGAVRQALTAADAAPGEPTFDVCARQLGRHGDPAVSASLDEITLQAWPLARLETTLDELIPLSWLLQVEADCYYCAGRLLSTLQSNYTPGLPGIARAGQQLEMVVTRAGGGGLITYLAEKSSVGLRDGCYQWLHCLLARELPLALLLPLWDSYLAAGDDHIMTVHVCVCAALVLELEKAIRASPPETVLRVLQHPFDTLFPTFAETSSTSETASSSLGSRWAKPMAWLEVLIADAYRLWRQCT